MPLSAPDSPPRAPPIKYQTPLGTRWQKEKATAGHGAFDYPDDAKYVGPWVIGECVGKGASGHVKIARHRRTGQLAAVKILPLQPFVTSRASLAAQAKSDKQRLGIDREITMMKLMNHPNIMHIYDVYEGEKELYLILEYVEGGELFDFLVNRGKLPPLEALAYFKQVIYGLNYAHTFSIIHRDLKPENILIHSLNPPLIKIADWGMAAFAPPSLQLETSCGSPHYASPEIVNGHKYCGTATDIWSCGVILFALLTGRLPFDDKNVRTLLSKVKLGRYEMPAYIDPLAKDLLTRMLVVDVSKRITMADVLVHPWLRGDTPGITYVPAPPVSELAQPLPSALHIDRDLFESLCVIWGRHADQNCIRADLLSPAGQGTLAKAFYFLLQKHRERTMEEHGILIDIDEVLNVPGKIVTKQYAAPRSKKSSRPEVQDQNRPAVPQAELISPGHVAPALPSRSPLPSTFTIDTDILMDRPPSRTRPLSPAGPRPQKLRPISAFVHPSKPAKEPTKYPVQNNTVEQVYSVSQQPRVPEPMPTTPRHQTQSLFVAPLPRGLPPPPTRRGSAPLPMSPPNAPTAPSNLSGSRPGYRRSMAAPSPVIHAPVPVSANATPMLPMITAPKAANAELQKTFDQYANIVNTQAASWNATRVEMQPASTTDDCMDVTEDAPAREVFSTGGNAGSSQPVESAPRNSLNDKENWDAGAGHRHHAHVDSANHAGGLGFGQSVPMAKEMGNLVFFNEHGFKEPIKEKRDRRSRPPTLDLQGTPLLQKRSTFSIIGSPSPMSPPSSFMGSPAVGEFKGWFSNLFHWKVQSYLLYSVSDIQTTRNETLRLLDQFGIIWVLEDHYGWHVVKCRTDDGHEGTAVLHRQVRFRIEVSSTAGSQGYSQPGMTPRLSQNPMSPQVAYFGGSKQRVDRMNGYESVIGLVLEKGAVSTFKAIYQRLRSEWRLDSLQSPRHAMAGGSTPSIEQRFMV